MVFNIVLYILLYRALGDYLILPQAPLCRPYYKPHAITKSRLLSRVGYKTPVG
jgi:hypothetical protein